MVQKITKKGLENIVRRDGFITLRRKHRNSEIIGMLCFDKCENEFYIPTGCSNTPDIPKREYIKDKDLIEVSVASSTDIPRELRKAIYERKYEVSV